MTEAPYRFARLRRPHSRSSANGAFRITTPAQARLR